MKPVSLANIETRGLTRRRLLTMGAMGLSAWMLSPLSSAVAAFQNDLALVATIPRMPQREDPLLMFRDFAIDPDVEVTRHIRRQLGEQKQLFEMVREKTGFEKRVRLSVEEVQVRLMYVPQLQERHSAAYHRYCLDITESLFKMTRTDNFYDAITRPNGNLPALSTSGVSAFLVHRTAKDYRAVCRFTSESGRSVKYAISGAIFSNHLGAVDLEIQLLAPGKFGLTRKPFTIWQNATRNLYTLMSIPVEETLHYCIGQATDREIAEAFDNSPPENLATAQRLAQSWMAVEESVVGGLVNLALVDYCSRHRMAVRDLTGEKMPAVPSLHQYRYRYQGIQLVQDLGFKNAMAMYMDSPSTFRAQLFRRLDA